MIGKNRRRFIAIIARAPHGKNAVIVNVYSHSTITECSLPYWILSRDVTDGCFILLDCKTPPDIRLGLQPWLKKGGMIYKRVMIKKGWWRGPMRLEISCLMYSSNITADDFRVQTRHTISRISSCFPWLHRHTISRISLCFPWYE